MSNELLFGIIQKKKKKKERIRILNIWYIFNKNISINYNTRARAFLFSHLYMYMMDNAPCCLCVRTTNYANVNGILFIIITHTAAQAVQ